MRPGAPGWNVTPMELASELPHVNAALNLSSALALATGYVFIRRRRVAAHRACMLAAAGLSAAFLACYVVYHLQVGSVPFRGTGWLRPAYHTLLASHALLAAAVVPLALLTLRRGLRGEVRRHRALAHWTLPLWLYVSASGVAVYWLLYHHGG